MTTIDVSGLTGDAAYLAIVPHMMHPDSVQDREEYEAFLLASLYSRAGEPLSPDITATLVRSARRAVASDAYGSTHGGILAGYVLLTLLSLAAAGRTAELGLDRAWFAVSRAFHGMPDRSGKHYRAQTRDTVRAHWRRFGRVAHLWAAHNLIIQDSSDLTHAPGLAAALHEMAQQHLLASSAPIMPADAVRIVGAPMMRVELDRLSEEVDKILAAFTPRSKA